MENANGAAKPVDVHQNGTSKNGVPSGVTKSLETAAEKRQRTISLVIVYFTLFLQSLGLAIAMTGVWPFLDKVSGKQCFSEVILLNVITTA